MYYAVSITMSMIQKYMLTRFADGEFQFPLTMTCVHMSIKVLLSAVALGFPCRRRGSCTMGLPRRDYLLFVVPIAAATAGDIALSNVALLTVTLTIYTIGKTSSILFNYSMSTLLKLQPARCVLTSIVACIFVGMVLASYKATDFHLLGFTAVVVAAFLAGTRWVLTERLFEKSGHRLKSMELLYVLSPLSVPLLLPFALATEAKPIMASPVWQDKHEAFVGVAVVLIAGVTSFLLILLELAIVSRTSALTTDVLGYVKNITLVVLAGVTYGDALSALNVVGVCVTFTGALGYSYFKSQLKSAPHRAAGVTDAQVAYDILSTLEMAAAWSDDDRDLGDSSADQDEDPVARHRGGSGLGLSALELQDMASGKL